MAQSLIAGLHSSMTPDHSFSPAMTVTTSPDTWTQWSSARVAGSVTGLARSKLNLPVNSGTNEGPALSIGVSRDVGVGLGHSLAPASNFKLTRMSLPRPVTNHLDVSDAQLRSGWNAVNLDSKSNSNGGPQRVQGLDQATGSPSNEPVPYVKPPEAFHLPTVTQATGYGLSLSSALAHWQSTGRHSSSPPQGPNQLEAPPSALASPNPGQCHYPDRGNFKLDTERGQAGALLSLSLDVRCECCFCWSGCVGPAQI